MTPLAYHFGYKASAEQFGPRELLHLSVLAERHGFDSVAVSDHFQPWRHHGGHSPAVLPWLGALGERTERVLIGTSVMTPTMRYQPAIVAQAFATLACLQPGRVFLGVGTGESLNETPATGAPWPGGAERRRRLEEAIRLMRLLWAQERVTFDGAYYHTERATVYDRPAEPIPIYVAAAGPLAAELAGRAGDGLVATSGKGDELYEQLGAHFAQAATKAGRDAATLTKFMEIKVSYDHDTSYARDACAWWAALGLSGEEKAGVDDPIEMERLADAARDRAHKRFIVSDDADEVVEAVGRYVKLGFTHLVFHAPGADQARFITQFAADVLPKLRERWDGGQPRSTFPARP